MSRTFCLQPCFSLSSKDFLTPLIEPATDSVRAIRAPLSLCLPSHCANTLTWCLWRVSILNPSYWRLQLASLRAHKCLQVQEQKHPPWNKNIGISSLSTCQPSTQQMASLTPARSPSSLLIHLGSRSSKKNVAFALTTWTGLSCMQPLPTQLTTVSERDFCTHSPILKGEKQEMNSWSLHMCFSDQWQY